MGIYIYIYPTALRAIPATVPKMFCVVRRGVLRGLGPACINQGSPKIEEQIIKKLQKSFPKGVQNHEKSRFGGVMGALGGGLGAIWAPRVAQDGPRVEKHGSLTAPWDPKSNDFGHFF